MLLYKSSKQIFVSVPYSSKRTLVPKRMFVQSLRTNILIFVIFAPALKYTHRIAVQSLEMDMPKINAFIVSHQNDRIIKSD